MFCKKLFISFLVACGLAGEAAAIKTVNAVMAQGPAVSASLVAGSEVKLAQGPAGSASIIVPSGTTIGVTAGSGTVFNAEIVGSLPTGTNAIGGVTLAQGPAGSVSLVAGSQVQMAQGPAGSVSLVAESGPILTSPASATQMAVYNEDSAFVAKSALTAPGFIVDAALSAITPADGDVAPGRLDANGAQWVSVSAALPAGDNNIGNVDLVTWPAIGPKFIFDVAGNSRFITGIVSTNMDDDLLKMGGATTGVPFSLAIPAGLVNGATGANARWAQGSSSPYFGSTGAKAGSAADSRSIGYSRRVGATLFEVAASGSDSKVVLAAGTNYFAVRFADGSATQFGYLNFDDNLASGGTGIRIDPTRWEVLRENLSVGATGTTLNISSGGADKFNVSVDYGLAEQ